MSVGGFGITLLGVVWAEFFLAFVLLIARLYTGLWIVRRVREDLYLAILTFVCSPAHQILTQRPCADLRG
jgi:hypothetical protein